ncbi:MAG: TIGR02646 family protein [Bacteroidia bacterium]|nr:MAG: TIGR02646 family protein [Bacteroidia bacterium]
MKHIKRQQSPVSFEQWKNENRTANWNDFSGTDLYKEVKNQLLNQQEQMCGYCEILIIKNGKSSHIEHLKDKQNFPKEEFNYDNFIASCQHRDSCGHKKGTNYFSNFVSPFDPNCQSRFTYTRNGRIIPSDKKDKDAIKTINILGLNCKRLVDRRKGIINTLEDMDNNYIEQSLKNCKEWYCGFYTVIEYMMH